MCNPSSSSELPDCDGNRGAFVPRFGNLVHGLALLLVALGSASAQAAIYRVGIGVDCTHSSLQPALNAAAANPNGPHTIRMVTGISQIPNLAITDPLADITVIGGHANCAANAPVGLSVNVLANDPASPQGKRILRIANSVGNPRRIVQLERIVIEGGREPSADLFLGGGLLIIGRVTVELGDLVTIRDNEARNGGGIALFNLNSNPDLATRLVMDRDVAILENRATGSGNNGNGGGVYALGGTRITLLHARIGFNHARRAGGGVFLGGANDSLLLDPTGSFRFVSIYDNTAGTNALDESEGFGGAIYSNQASIGYGSTLTPSGAFNIGIFNNTANFGGALFAEGGSAAAASYTTLQLRNAALSLNMARRQGGAIYLRNAVELQLRRWGQGQCTSFGEARRPCVTLRGNSAFNSGGNLNFGAGGVAFMTNDSGAQGPRLRVSGALFQENEDTNGTVALVDARNLASVEISRSILVDNIAGGTASFRSLIESQSDLKFPYNTVIAQASEVRQLFLLPTVGNVAALGSILHTPGVDLINSSATARISHSGCLISHTQAGLLANDLSSVRLLAPRLDADHVPRGGSAALDNCDLSDDTTLISTREDAFGNLVVDHPSVPNAPWGPQDLGAIERVDLLFYGGFGTRPDN